MPRQTLGPWGRWYASTIEDTAHFTDRQFRAWATVFSLATKNRGELPKLRPLQAIIGTDEVAFLVEEGFLCVDGATVDIPKWSSYQAPVDRTNAERQARFRASKETGSGAVDNVLSSPDNGVTNELLPTSAYTSVTNEEPTEKKNGVSDGDRDALDRFYELTMSYPWGRKSGKWIADLQDDHGVENVVAALEVEWKADRTVNTLLGRVAARLAKQADRVEKAAERERHRQARKLEPWQEEYRAAVAAKYEQAVPSDPGTRNGLSLTAAEGSDTEVAAVSTSVGESGSAISSSPSGSSTRSDRTGRTNDRSAPTIPTDGMTKEIEG